jgi:hypothetical protein
MWQDQEVFWLLFDLSGGSFEAGKALAESAHERRFRGLAPAREHLAIGLGCRLRSVQ